MRRLLLVGVLLGWVSHVAADSSVPQPSPSGHARQWQFRCADELRRAHRKLVREDPAFAGGKVTFEANPRGIRFEAFVADREHARFFAGVRAHFLARVIEKVAKEPGAIGVDVGSPKDEQASLGLTSWTTQRQATLDAQIVEGRKAFRFGRYFKPAVAACLNQ